MSCSITASGSQKSSNPRSRRRRCSHPSHRPSRRRSVDGLDGVSVVAHVHPGQVSSQCRVRTGSMKALYSKRNAAQSRIRARGPFRIGPPTTRWPASWAASSAVCHPSENHAVILDHRDARRGRREDPCGAQRWHRRRLVEREQLHERPAVPHRRRVAASVQSATITCARGQRSRSESRQAPRYGKPLTEATTTESSGSRHVSTAPRDAPAPPRPPTRALK